MFGWRVLSRCLQFLLPKPRATSTSLYSKMKMFTPSSCGNNDKEWLAVSLSIDHSYNWCIQREECVNITTLLHWPQREWSLTTPNFPRLCWFNISNNFVLTWWCSVTTIVTGGYQITKLDVLACMRCNIIRDMCWNVLLTKLNQIKHLDIWFSITSTVYLNCVRKVC